jgi:hypothetical protein
MTTKTRGPESPAKTPFIRHLDRIGRSQRGLITSAQLQQLGLGRSGRYWALAGGRLTPIRRGVYLLPGVQISWDTSVLAAVLAAGPDAVASHLTAAHLWDLFDGRPLTDTNESIHLTGSSQHHLGGVDMHRTHLDPKERSTRHQVSVTSAARTIFDLASVIDATLLGRCTDEALRRRVLTLREIHRLVELHRGPGRRRLDPLYEVLAERLPGYDPGANEWEQRMDRLWDELCLPAAQRQYRIVAGGRRHRVDRAIPDLRLAVEWVGNEYHGQVSRFAQDRIRISDLVQSGWDVLEITPGWTAARLRGTVLAKVAERRRLFEEVGG